MWIAPLHNSFYYLFVRHHCSGSSWEKLLLHFSECVLMKPGSVVCVKGRAVLTRIYSPSYFDARNYSEWNCKRGILPTWYRHYSKWYCSVVDVCSRKSKVQLIFMILIEGTETTISETFRLYIINVCFRSIHPCAPIWYERLPRRIYNAALHWGNHFKITNLDLIQCLQADTLLKKV